MSDLTALADSDVKSSDLASVSSIAGHHSLILYLKVPQRILHLLQGGDEFA